MGICPKCAERMSATETVCPSCGWDTSLHEQHPIVVTTGDEVAGRSIVGYVGIVRGIVVRSPSIAQGVVGGLKQILGGNIETYVQVCESARKDAYQRMVQHALELDADAVIAMRYDATDLAPNVTEVIAYGTAVKLSKG